MLMLLMNGKLHYVLSTVQTCCTSIFDFKLFLAYMHSPLKLNQLSEMSVIDVDFPYKCFKNSVCCANSFKK